MRNYDKRNPNKGSPYLSICHGLGRSLDDFSRPFEEENIQDRTPSDIDA